jgi:uncharacterized PurR-regulated membrane protein YhhQ (DUF165 family)
VASPLHPIEASHLHARRERVFLVLAGLFLGTLTMLNILGISRFVKFATFETAGGLELTFAVAVGVLPYPVTFLCTDFISEFYGRKRFWKKLTNGRYLWSRNNGSTLVSQLVDTVAVILITHFFARALPVDLDRGLAIQLVLFIATGYAYKLTAALVDTIPFYIGVRLLSGYLELDPMKEHEEVE